MKVGMEARRVMGLGTVALPKSALSRTRDVLRSRPRETRTAAKVPLSKEVLQDTTAPAYDVVRSLNYLIARLPASYAINRRVFHEISLKDESFYPRSMLDFGSGPGSSVLAANETWGHKKDDPGVTDFLERILAVEPSTEMQNIGRTLLKGSHAEWRRFFFSLTEDSPKFDLVVASFVLLELVKSNLDRKSFIENLWKCVDPGGMLVLIEKGTPEGFATIKEARSAIIKLGFNKQIVAPCPHMLECPLSNSKFKSWCHFSQRVQRTQYQLPLPRKVNWKDEKFSYVVFRNTPMIEEPRKGDDPEQEPQEMDDSDNEALLQKEEQIFDDFGRWVGKERWSRILFPPLKRSKHVYVDSCDVDGQFSRRIVAKSDGKELYTAARKSKWGDLFDPRHVEGREVTKPHAKFLEKQKLPSGNQPEEC